MAANSSHIDLIAKYPKNPFRSGTQNYRVYEVLIIKGKVDTLELADQMYVRRGAARVWDINQFLKPFLLAVKCNAVPNKRGVFEYILL